MAAVYDTMNRHGRHLDIESEEYRGTTDSIYLPATERQERQ